MKENNKKNINNDDLSSSPIKNNEILEETKKTTYKNKKKLNKVNKKNNTNNEIHKNTLNENKKGNINNEIHKNALNENKKSNINNELHKNIINENKKNNYQIQKKPKYKDNDEINEIIKNKKIEKEISNSIDIVLQNNNLIDDDILIKNPKQLTLNLYYTIKHLLDAEQRLKKQNIILDKALQDIVHKIEGDKFNVVEGYKLAKKIQIIRNKKNLIRESLVVYEKLNGLGLNIEENINDLSKIIMEIEQQDKKVEYKPKVLKDLKFRYDNETIYKKYEDIKKDDLKTLGINEID